MLLIAEVLGHLRLERRFQHSFREPVQQPVGADEVDALFLRLHQQLLRELLLVDDLTRHRIDHLDDIGHRLSFRSGPTRSTVNQTVPGIFLVAGCELIGGRGLGLSAAAVIQRGSTG